MLQTFSLQDWNAQFSEEKQQLATSSLESGQILFFPQLTFELKETERIFLSPDYVDPHAKNISYHAEQHKLWGVQHLSDTQHLQLKKCSTASRNRLYISSVDSSPLI